MYFTNDEYARIAADSNRLTIEFEERTDFRPTSGASAYGRIGFVVNPAMLSFFIAGAASFIFGWLLMLSAG